MVFGSPKALKQLMEIGRVWSFRTRSKERGSKVWIRKNRTGPKIGEAKIKRCDVITTYPKDHFLKLLEKYNEPNNLSGFSSSREWFREIKKFHNYEDLRTWEFVIYLEKLD